MLYEAEYYEPGPYWSRAHRDELEVADRYQIPYLKAFFELERQGVFENPELPVERYGLPMGVVDLANVGMHLFDAGAVLGPLWLSFVSFDTPRWVLELAQKRSLLQVNYPGLRFYTLDRGAHEVEDEQAYEARLEALFDQADRFVRRDFAIPCVVARRYSNKGFGFRVPGIFHERYYICEIEYAKPREQLDRDVTVQVSTIHDPKRMNLEGEAHARDLIGSIHLHTWLWKDFQPYRQGDAAVRLFAAMRERMPEGWYAVFSGPDGRGNWKVFVSNGEHTVAFDPPQEKRRGR